jgi:hypothetical protein
MLSLHAQENEMRMVRKSCSSHRQTIGVLGPSLEKVVHVPWHFQPALLTVWAIAHAYATFVAASIGIIVAHRDHVRPVKTSASHG